MQLSDLLKRTLPPQPWAEGENIPWNDPEFSERMLREHLSQEHDAASRRLDLINQQIDWILAQAARVFGVDQSLRILDLGCGPGLYTSELARRGHTCTGIDYSPSSIRYAKETAHDENLDCSYQLADLRQVDFGMNHDLVMFVFGEFNIFRPEHAAQLLTRAYAALKPGGMIVLEPHTFDFVEDHATNPPNWFTSEGSLFSPEDHLVLEENFWDPDLAAGTTRYYIISAVDAQVIMMSASYQAYYQEEYLRMFVDVGFDDIQFYPSLIGKPDERLDGLMAIIARKGE